MRDSGFDNRYVHELVPLGRSTRISKVKTMFRSPLTERSRASPQPRLSCVFGAAGRLQFTGVGAVPIDGPRFTYMAGLHAYWQVAGTPMPEEVQSARS